VFTLLLLCRPTFRTAATLNIPFRPLCSFVDCLTF